MAMKTPVIIHYKDNGKDDGFDLKMTLRSFNRFMPNIGEVVVVGDRHEWMSDAVTVIPFRHPYASDKDSNIMMACLKGASYLAIDRGHDGSVVVASDDCVLLSPYEEKLYYEEKSFQFMEAFPRRLKQNSWWERPYQSILHCMTLGWTADSCEAHVPQFVSVGAIMTLLDARVGEVPLGVKTIIVNAERTIGMRDAEKAGPLKIHPQKLTVDMDACDAPPYFCNWCPSSETDEFKAVLLEIFPQPSRYENAI